jgi:hypothetical protein
VFGETTEGELAETTELGGSQRRKEERIHRRKFHRNSQQEVTFGKRG